jgi:hypothetical protein
MPIVHQCKKDHKDFDGTVEEEGKWELPGDCPCCNGKDTLQRWSSYWRLALAGSSSTGHRVKIIRMRCKTCGKTMAILPSFLAPYQRVITMVREEIVQSKLLGQAGDVWLKRRALA